MTTRRNTGPGISFFAFQDIITAVVGIFILIMVILVLELAQRVETASAAPTQDIKPVIETIEELKQQISASEAEIEKRSAVVSRSEGINAFNIADKVDQLRHQNQTLKNRIKASNSKQRNISSEISRAQTNSQKLAMQTNDLSGQRQEFDELSETSRKIREKEQVLLDDDSTVYRDVTEDGRYMVLVTLSPGMIEIRDALTRSVKSFSGARRLDEFESWLDAIPLARRHLLLMIEPGGEVDFATMNEAAKTKGAQYGFTVVGAKHVVRLGYELGKTP